MNSHSNHISFRMIGETWSRRHGVSQMITKNIKKTFSALLSFVFAATSPQILYGFQTPGATSEDNTGTPTEGAPMSASQLQALVAPIALYPDSLVAQILTASTFPDQVAIANYWLQQNNSLTG